MKKVFSKHKWIEWAGKEKYLEEKNYFENIDAVFWIDACDGKTALECDELGILVSPDWMIELTDEDYEDLQEVIKIDRLLTNIENDDNNSKKDIDEFEQLEKLQKENEQLRLILGNQIRIKDDLLKRINKAIETIESWHFALDWAENDRLKIIKEILKKGGIDE